MSLLRCDADAFRKISIPLQATRLARAMVTKYGMSDVMGKVSINYDDNGRSISSETRSLIESEVRQLRLLGALRPIFTSPLVLK